MEKIINDWWEKLGSAYKLNYVNTYFPQNFKNKRSGEYSITIEEISIIYRKLFLCENTKLTQTKTDNYDKIDKRLDWLWYETKSFSNKNGIEIKPNSEKICNIYFDKRGGKDLYMIRYDRYSDSSVFNDIVDGRYVANEIGRKIDLVKSGDFGSANEGFIASDEGLKLAITELKKHGYEVGFTNILER